MSKIKIYVVEDDTWYGNFLEHYLSRNPDYEVSIFKTGKDLIHNLDNKPDIITLDYSLPDYTGEELLKKVKTKQPATSVVIVSSQQDIGTAINLLKDGAYDYIVKDENAGERLWNTIRNIVEKVEMQEELLVLREEVDQKYDFNNIIKGDSDGIKSIFKLMSKAVKSDINVSITGETGTGKEVVAKAIHHNSGRKNKKFVAVNVAAIPKELIESELFGHEKGSFTGAQSRRIGKFEEAHNGTLFLDEIGEMDVNLQSKLLRVLQEQEVTRVGSNTPVKINVRLITATHKNLSEQVRLNLFREDLYYRIIGLPISLPPLRDRKSDIIILANFFLEEYASRNGMPKTKISTEAREKLIKYPFPGNVRELRSIIELASVMCEGSEINVEDITFHSVDPEKDIMSEELTLREYSIRILKAFLAKYNNNVTQVSKKLDIGRSTVYQMLKEVPE